MSGELLFTPCLPARWGVAQLRVWGSWEIRGRRSRPGFPGEEHRQFGIELMWRNREGVRLSVDWWWLRIHSAKGAS